MIVIAFTALIALASCLVVEELPTDHKTMKLVFEKLHTAHNRTYELGSSEHKKRFHVYKKNIMRIKKFREMDKGAKYALNMFFDISEEEFQMKYKMPKRRIPDQSDLTGQLVARSCLGGGAQKKRDVDEELKNFKAPASFDWRQHKPQVVSPVKNQGQCGSCWAFSTAETLESAWALAGHNLVELSPQEIVDCSQACSMENGQKVCNQGCGGGWPWAAADTIINQLHGLELGVNYPYHASQGACKANPAKIAARAKNWTCISGPHTASPTQIQHALMKQPLSIAINAGSWQFYSGGVSDPWMCDKKTLDHAVQIVGYGEHTSWTGSKEPYWMVRNSWSAMWGLNGYIMVKRGSNTCGIGNAVMQIDV